MLGSELGASVFVSDFIITAIDQGTLTNYLKIF
jgi:hypothetical protein